MTSVVNTNVIIKHTGEVQLGSHALLESTCDFVVTYFPFDEQDCRMSFSSWTYDNSEVRWLYPYYYRVTLCV